MDSKIAGHSLSFSSQGYFGRAVAVLAAERDDNGLWGESYLLVERGTARLHGTLIHCDLKQAPSEIESYFDLDFMMREALTAAEASLAGLREKRFQETNDWSVFSSTIAHTDIASNSVAWAVALAPWQPELKRITEVSQRSRLTEWLQLVRRIRSLISIQPIKT